MRVKTRAWSGQTCRSGSNVTRRERHVSMGKECVNEGFTGGRPGYWQVVKFS